MADPTPPGLPGYSFSATPEARAALAEVQQTHGKVIFHRAGGASDQQLPILLSAGELILGGRDRLLGAVCGVPVYEMESTESLLFCGGDYLLDVAPGLPVGFSLGPGAGKRFTFTLVGTAGACQTDASEREDAK